MRTEVNSTKTERLHVQLTEDDLERFVRQALDLDTNDWSLEQVDTGYNSVELVFEKYESDTRESP